MKKRNSKKGFTLVELVIVIAVIAILAGVLIPTFGGIIKKANASAALQEATNKWKEFYALDLSDGKIDGKDGETDLTKTGDTAVATGYTAEGKFSAEINGYTVTFDGKEWKTEEKTNTSTDGTGENTNTGEDGK